MDLNSLMKNESKNENNNIKEKILLNIDTLQSLRISHSNEKSKNSQSLIDIINKGNYNFEENNENDMNIINKNNNEQDSFNTNKGMFNSNYKSKNSFISIESIKKSSNKKINLNINTNNNDTSAMTKNSVMNNHKKTEFNSKNNFISFSLGEKNKEKFKDMYRNNKNKIITTYKFNIEEMFKERFEEKIKPKLKNSEISAKNAIIKNNQCCIDINEVKIEPKTLEHQNKINYLFNLDSNNLNNYKNDSIDEKNDEGEKKIDCIQSIDNNIKKKELCFSNLDKDKQHSIESLDDIEDDNDYVNQTNKNIDNEKSNELIVGMFGGKPDSSLEEESNSKNVVISELDIDISDSIKNNNLNKKKLSNEEIKKNNINLEKAIETNLKKGNFNNFDNFKLKNVSKDKEESNLYSNICNNKQKLSSGSMNKKSKFNKKILKKVYSIKKINSYSNIKNIKSIKNEEKINFLESNIGKAYKYSPTTIKFVDNKNNNNLNYINRNIHELKNTTNNSGSHEASFIALNTSINNNIKNSNNRRNIIYKKMTYTLEKNKEIKSPFHSNSQKEKKMKNIYNNINHNNIYKKISNNNFHNIIAKDIKNFFLNRNNSKILKSLYTTTYNSNNSNNIPSKEILISIPNIISDDNKNRNKKNDNIFKNNTGFNSYLKNNKKKFFDFPKNFSISSSKNNNNYVIKLLNNSIHNNNNKNNFYNYEKQIKNKKKNDIPICNINKNKIPLKRISLKKNELYSNNEKIRNKINSVNNIINRASSHRTDNKNNFLNIDNDSYCKYKYSNLLSNNKYDENTIYNSYTNNIKINSNKTYLSHFKGQLNNSKNINNNVNNSSLLMNNNINNNEEKSFLTKKIDKRLLFNKNSKLTKENKENINFLTEITNLGKNYPYLNKIIKNIINSKSKNNKRKKRIINDKIISKNYLRNISQKNDSSNLKLSNGLLAVNSNDKKTINTKTKILNSYRNNIKSINVEEAKNIPLIFKKYKLKML